MKLQEKLRLIRGYRKLSTTKLEYILSDTLSEIHSLALAPFNPDSSFDKRKELLTVKVIVESELKDRLKDLLDIFESYNIKH